VVGGTTKNLKYNEKQDSKINQNNDSITIWYNLGGQHSSATSHDTEPTLNRPEDVSHFDKTTHTTLLTLDTACKLYNYLLKRLLLHIFSLKNHIGTWIIYFTTI
jgi:hypothetical protein